MKAGRFFNGWNLAVMVLALVIIAGGTVILTRDQRSPGIEIALATPKEIEGQICVGGGVNNPGIYPFYAGDTLEDIIRAAGGLQDGVDAAMLELTVSAADETNTPQKININRAEAWLLEALPGVGEVKAQAIIDYRQQNGLFRDVNELLKVPGFGDANYEKVKDFITVHD